MIVQVNRNFYMTILAAFAVSIGICGGAITYFVISAFKHLIAN